MHTLEQMTDAYKKHEQLYAAAEDLGMKWQTLYYHLKKAGVAVAGNKARRGSETDKFAAKGERLFHSLVPFAVDKNAEQFQSKCDFVVSGVKVDVKSARPKKPNARSPGKRWAFSFKKQLMDADFMVCFAFDEAGDVLQHLFLIPVELCGDIQTLSIPTTGNSKWFQFEVQPNDLADFFKLDARTKKQ